MLGNSDDDLIAVTASDTSSSGIFISGGTGADFIEIVTAEAATAEGGSETDRIRGGSGSDRVTGGTGNDTLFSNAGTDINWSAFGQQQQE